MKCDEKCLRMQFQKANPYVSSQFQASLEPPGVLSQVSPLHVVVNFLQKLAGSFS